MKSTALEVGEQKPMFNSPCTREKVSSIQLLWASQGSNSDSSSFLMRMAFDIKRRRAVKQVLEQPETPRSSSRGKVFERLLVDSNRRQISKQRIAKLAEEKFEEEVSQLQLKRTVHTKSTRVFDRLFADSKTRNTLKHLPVLEKSTSCASLTKEAQDKMLKRLSTPRNEAYDKWNQIKIKREEQIFAQIEEIRRKRHPQRTLDTERNKRLASPRSLSPQTKTFSFKPAINQLVCKPWKRMLDLDDSMTRLKVQTKISK